LGAFATDIDIYMEYPKGVKPKPGCDALLLKKSLYGLKQSGRTWWIELGNKLATLVFRRLESDWGLYVKPQTQEEDPVLILVYVDDFVIAAGTTTVIKDLLKKLKGFFKVSETGEVSSILGTMHLHTTHHHLHATHHQLHPAPATSYPSSPPCHHADETSGAGKTSGLCQYHQNYQQHCMEGSIRIPFPDSPGLPPSRVVIVTRKEVTATAMMGLRLVPIRRYARC
jgi:hypothetical protein